jgi:hypothetical protein
MNQRLNFLSYIFFLLLIFGSGRRTGGMPCGPLPDSQSSTCVYICQASWQGPQFGAVRRVKGESSPVLFDVSPLTSWKVKFDLYLPRNKRFTKTIDLFASIDPKDSTFQYFGTKVHVCACHITSEKLKPVTGWIASQKDWHSQLDGSWEDR